MFHLEKFLGMVQKQADDIWEEKASTQNFSVKIIVNSKTYARPTNKSHYCHTSICMPFFFHSDFSFLLAVIKILDF